MQKLLTIVVPVYKVEQYINKCLDSCIVHKADGSLDEEKMNRLEVIIVNDGTPDRSAELSREYTVRYPQTFRQIDKKNGGHGSAWNVGLKEATGKYLRFLDSDDWLTNLDKLMGKLARIDTDLIFTSKYTFVDNCKSESWIDVFDCIYDKILPIDSLPLKQFQKYPWYGEFQKTTYNTKLLQPLYPLFAEGTHYDDVALYIIPLLYAKTFIAYDFIVYNYLIGRPGQSMATDVQNRNANQRFAAYKSVYDFVNSTESTRYMSELSQWILLGFYNNIIPVFMNLPYLESKHYRKLFEQYKPAYIKESTSKMAIRLEKYPFLIAYILEKIRKIKNHRCE